MALYVFERILRREIGTDTRLLVDPSGQLRFPSHHVLFHPEAWSCLLSYTYFPI